MREQLALFCSRMEEENHGTASTSCARTMDSLWQTWSATTARTTSPMGRTTTTARITTTAGTADRFNFWLSIRGHRYFNGRIQMQEGETHALPVIMLRKRQMRNLFLCLMVSQGVPMILMGDEYGHSKGGNNNTYCHDNHVLAIDQSDSMILVICLVVIKNLIRSYRRGCSSTISAGIRRRNPRRISSDSAA